MFFGILSIELADPGGLDYKDEVISSHQSSSPTFQPRTVELFLHLLNLPDSLPLLLLRIHSSPFHRNHRAAIMSAEKLWQNLVLLIDRLSPDDPINPRPVYRRSRCPRRSNYDGPADDSSSDEGPLTYEKLQEAGAHLEQAMEDSSVVTRVRRSTMTLDDLEMSPDSWDINVEQTQRLPYGYSEKDVANLELPDGDYTRVVIDGWNQETNAYLGTTWEGRAKESVMFIECIARHGYGPYASELGIMAYERVAPLPTLKTIFVANVMNNETRPAARTIWYGPEMKVFQQGSADFQAFLGTGIGKFVAYTILGAFGQGVKKVSAISLWYIGQRQDILQMRFDIEDV
ncbi:uncharacterized protein N7496_008703 [Penicillium cataractarum]|uniref:Uncharacterized protein n=1 Tax=Penicillium cataractarum TaxID=2100454 RepID=A0A9W9RYX8_9EURO|nr:uncharacterized protein N7496_008703 [Penicillium cataractarum]KAJ5368943.1 hypothetical protein N7496_008703 [Penicillium cataractarum]